MRFDSERRAKKILGIIGDPTGRTTSEIHEVLREAEVESKDREPRAFVTSIDFPNPTELSHLLRLARYRISEGRWTR